MMICVKLIIIVSKENKIRQLADYSIVRITINGTGYQNYINFEENYFTTYPVGIQVNGISQSSLQRQYYLEQEISEIRVYFSADILNCGYMFYRFENITKIIFSNFDFSKVTTMVGMFFGCTSLTSISFGTNYNTSSIKNMDSMFYCCISLLSLDLGNFDTKSVLYMNRTFFNCSSLVSLNLNNFDTNSVITMFQMFSGCFSLERIYLGSFNTQSLEDMGQMFFDCRSLISLDLDSFDTSSVSNMQTLFYNCISLIDLKINNFNTALVENMVGLFYNCFLLISLDLNHFVTSSVNSMAGMFYECTSLQSIKLDNFITSNVVDMGHMFYDCNSLISLNLNNFDTSSVSSMQFMFFRCTSLESLNLDSFDTSSVTLMNYMFCDCSSLHSLNLDNFDTSSVNNMFNMFLGCGSLESLEIRDFNTRSIEMMYNMFKDCNSLISLDLYNFDLDKLDSSIGMFDNINPELIYCINIKSEDEKIDSLIDYTFNCSYFCFKRNQKYIAELNECINNCFEHPIYKIEYMHICYRTCPNELFYDYINNQCLDSIPEGYYLKNVEQKLLEKCPIKCKKCSNESISNNLCDLCNDGYYEIYNDNQDAFKDCYHEKPEGYYFDNNNQVFKSCYSNCKNCDVYGNEENNKCTECYSNYIKIGENCYRSCTPNYYFFNSTNDYQCTQDKNCPNEYSKLIKDRNECIYDCNNDTLYIYEYKESCYKNCPLGTKIKNNNTCEEVLICTDEVFYIIIETGECSYNCTAINFFNNICKINSDDPHAKDEMINTIRADLLKGDINPLLIPKVFELNEDLIVKDKNMVYQLTSSYNQNINNEKVNISIIKLGECEKILKRNYNLNDEDELIIFKIEIYNEGFLIPIIEYEVYNLKIKEKLDLNMCNGTKIQIFHSVDINENKLFIYDSSGEFYYDKCYPYTTKDNTDIILEDRKNEFIDKNLSLCEANCEYNGYDLITKKAECQCQAKTKIPLMYEFKIDKDLLLNNFKNVEKTTNLMVLKCYYVLFTFEGFFKNIGNYILLVIIFIDIFCMIFFVYKGRKILYYRIQCYIDIIHKYKKEKIMSEKISNNKKSLNINELKEEKIDNTKQSLKRNELIGEKEKKFTDREEKMITNKISINNINIYNEKNDNPPKKKVKIKKVKKSKKIIKIENNNELKSKEISSSHDIINNIKIVNNNKFKNNDIDIKKKSEEVIINNLDNNFNYNYNDYELNNLKYSDALKFDKRTYFEYYFSLLKQKQLLVFTFYTYTDYNSKIIKISLFFFFLALYLTVNALFFNDSTMHKIYLDEGKFNFVYQIPKILYSSIISTLINTIISYLSLTQKNVLKLKEEEDDTKVSVEKFSKCLKIKFIIFFVLEFLFLLFFWYYISCFCAVYRNTQIHFFKTSLISFGLSLIYPFGISLIPGTVRIPSLRTEKKELECAYKFSKILQLF